MSNDKTHLLKLVEDVPEWSPPDPAGSGAMPVADLPAEKKKGRPRKVQPDAVEGVDTDNPSPVAVRGEGRGGKRLLKILSGMAEDIRLYYDSFGAGYISFSGENILELSGNKLLEEKLSLLYYEKTGDTLGHDGFRSAVVILSAQAKQTGTQIELFTRAGKHEDRFYYDLKNHRALSIGADGWEVVRDAPVFFHHFSVQHGHPDPLAGGSAWEIFNYCNAPEENRLLLVVWLIAAFIPGFDYPALLVSGSEGSGKSSFSQMLKGIIDPSAAELQEMPDKELDFNLLVYKHHCLALDNLSKLHVKRADRICSAISGAAVEIRELFSTADTKTLCCRPRFILNGINSLTNRTDLLDRSISIRLERIPPDKRKPKDQLDANFRADLPGILGGIADTLSKAMVIFPTVNLKSLPRMAEFAQWGYAVAEALGNRGAEFLKAYGANSKKLGESLLENNTLMSGLVMLMDDKDTFRGTFKEVVDALAMLVQPDRNDYSFPSTHQLRGYLERLQPSLEARGIKFVFGAHKTNRGYTVEFTKSTPPPTWDAAAASGVQVDDDIVFDDTELP
jgi:energy-coupling factor transporter ATP-binding protein EcfA2